MAEIHIVRRRPSALWLAVLGIALLLLAIWALWSVLGNDEPVDATVDSAELAAVDGAGLAAAPLAAPAGEVAEQPGVPLAGQGDAVAPVGEATAVPDGQLAGQQTGSAAVPIAPPAEAVPGQQAAQAAGAVSPPAQRPLGVQPAAAFVVPDVDAKATPIEARLRSPYVGKFVSDSITLFVRDNGTYEITRSAAGPGRGPWTVLREHGVLFLDPADGSQDRYFRIQDPDTLIPLNPRGKQPAQMTELLRREPEGAAGR